jgi:predicted LPLAT superfamily acyltransferase
MSTVAPKKLGSALGYWIFNIFIRVGGCRAAYALLNFVCAFYVLFRGQVRRSCAPYVQHRFVLAVGFTKLWHQYKMVFAFGQVMVDRAIVASLGETQIQVSLQGRERLLQVRDQGRGMILLLSHVGCWQLAMSAMGALEEPIYMLMHGDASSFESKTYERGDGRQQCPYRIINPQGYLGGALEMLGVLKYGGILSIMGDRVPAAEKNTVRVAFMGQEVALPISAYHLASATAAPIVVLTSRKIAAKNYEMVVADVVEVAPGLGRRPENFTPYAQRYAAILEKYCQEHPYQFFNFFDMWQ